MPRERGPEIPGPAGGSERQRVPGSPPESGPGAFAVIKALAQIYWRRSLNGNTVECGLFCVQELHLSQK